MVHHTETGKFILEKQNEPQQLDRLAAQCYLYARAKIYLGLQITLTIGIPFVLAISANLWPQVKVWASLWGICVSLLDAAVLESIQKSRKLEAAKIQELFDCDVLVLPWNPLKVGQRPDPETVAAAAKSYKTTHRKWGAVTNWYPPAIAELPLQPARLICQRTNCWWDANLRRRYSSWIVGSLSLLGILVLVIGILTGITLEKFVLAILAPLSSAFLWGIREYKKQKAAALTLDRLKSFCESLWGRAKYEEVSEDADQSGRALQDEIFDHRKSNPLIVDWFYRLLRDRNEEQMNKGAEHLVQEYLASRQKN